MRIIDALLKQIRGQQGNGEAPVQPSLFPEGHFYSPVPNLVDVRAREHRIWQRRDHLPGLELNSIAQIDLLRNAFSLFSGEIHFPTRASNDPTIYFYDNDQFPALDAEVLYCMLRHLAPRRMIEVGSGFSSLVTASVNRSALRNSLHFTCIEPFPRQFLQDGVPGISDLLVKPVQDVDLSFFGQLGKDDILFIDSSHVSKIGSDVNFLLLDVLPRLATGVYVHLHDIFLPDEYPREWMIEEGRHWNEQYLVQAFLQFNRCFEVVWAAHFMATRHRHAVRQVFPRFPSLGGGGSLWLRRVQ